MVADRDDMTQAAAPSVVAPTGFAGLTAAEARRRLTEHGANTVAEKVRPRWQTFLAKFWSPIA